MNMDEEKRYYDEITDIREELSMIKSVLFEQEKVWTLFTRKTWAQSLEGWNSSCTFYRILPCHAVRHWSVSLATSRAIPKMEKGEFQAGRDRRPSGEVDLNQPGPEAETREHERGTLHGHNEFRSLRIHDHHDYHHAIVVHHVTTGASSRPLPIPPG